LNWDAIGAVGEVIGAGGVIASLLYLSVQIRRSDHTARAESLSSVLDGWRDRSGLHLFINNEVPDLFAKGLTDFEMLGARVPHLFDSRASKEHPNNAYQFGLEFDGSSR
jgi:hypothetical protein